MKKYLSRFFMTLLPVITIALTLTGCVEATRGRSGDNYSQNMVSVKDVMRFANIRANPDIYAPIIARAPGGTSLYIVGEEHNGWIQISTENGAYGWISTELVE